MSSRSFKFTPDQLEETTFISNQLQNRGRNSLLGQKDLVIRIKMHQYQAYFLNQVLKEDRHSSLPPEVPCRRNITRILDQQMLCGARPYTGKFPNFPFLCPFYEATVLIHSDLGDRQDEGRSTSTAEARLFRIEKLHRRSTHGNLDIREVYANGIALRRGEFRVHQDVRKLTSLPTNRDVRHNSAFENDSDYSQSLPRGSKQSHSRAFDSASRACDLQSPDPRR